MKLLKCALGKTAALLLFGGVFAFSNLLPSPASADIYQWTDEGGGLHFTDDISNIPAKHRKKAREIQKTPPEDGRPSLSTIRAPSTPPGPTPAPESSSVGQAVDQPSIEADDTAAQAEKLRAKIDAKERFIRTVDEKRSLATNPYRNRFVSPSDMELYGKYKEELPGDRENLKALESGGSPVRNP